LAIGLAVRKGWKIIDSQKWTNPVNKIGIRPLLRYFTNRYYIVYAERKSKLNKFQIPIKYFKLKRFNLKEIKN
jgi:hypothetical protein